MFSVRFEHEPSPPPRIRRLPEIVEDKVLRAIACPGCGSHYAVYGASAFCPACGRRAATDTVLEGIEAGRRALALEEHLPCRSARCCPRCRRLRPPRCRHGEEHRRSVRGLRSQPVRVPRRQPGDRREGQGQRIPAPRRTAQLVCDHCGIDVPATVGHDVWQRLRDDFARRHVLTHCDGIVDDKSSRRSATAAWRSGCGW
jgi:hypothetical protein